MKKILFLITITLCLYAENSFLKNNGTQSGMESKSSDKINIDQYIKVSLIDAVLETVSQSNNVKAAREKVRQSKIKLDNGLAEYLPSVNAQYKNTRTFTQPGDANNTGKYYNDESYKLSITQNVYKGGYDSNQIKSLEKKYDVEKNSYKLVIAKEIENAIKAYFDVLFNFKSFNVNIENMERLNEILEIINIQYESGATSIGNLSNVQASVSNAESKLIRVQSKFNESLEFYTYIVGDNFQTTFPYEDDFDTTVDDFDKIVAKALENNTKIKNYNLSISAEKYNLKQAKSSFKPKIDLELSGENILDQEDYTNDIQNYKAQVLMTYNFYNKGKDKNKLLTINSKIRELTYRKKEEIRKLKWSLSKLHRSIISITNASVSKKKEVSASEDMVLAYWDGFKLGEQDLQELLQGQRQLNSAQIELIENKKTTITDYFKLLASTGELLNYFRLDINSDNYIDFTKSEYKNLLKEELIESFETKEDKKTTSKENNEEKDIDTVIETESHTPNILDVNSSVLEDTNTSKESDLNLTINSAIPQNDSLDSLLNYEKIFLDTDSNKWTIWIHEFDKVYQVLDFSKEKNMTDNIFVFDSFMQNQMKSNIAYGIFDTKELAIQSMQDLNITKKNKSVVNIDTIKNKYNNFKNKKFQTKSKKRKIFETNKVFKKKFLTAPKEYYTLNITSFSSMKEAEEMIIDEKIGLNTFVFKYGEKNEWTKVMYGVFDSYESANKALDKLQTVKAKYEPIIELIESKQKLYYEYNTRYISNKQAFTKRFLNADENSFTINLATLQDEKSAMRFRKRYENKMKLFIFKFGKGRVYYKVMTGVFSSMDEAYFAIESFDPSLKKNKPRVENIKSKQKLYFKYNKLLVNKLTTPEVK